MKIKFFFYKMSFVGAESENVRKTTSSFPFMNILK